MAFILLFVMSCESYGDIRYYVALIIFFITISTCFYFNSCLSKRAIKIFFLSILAILLLGFVYYVPVLSFKININDYSYKDFLFSILFKLLMSFVILSAIEYNVDIFRKVLGAVIAAHIAVFIMQLSVVYLTGYYVDLLYPITGEAQRYEALFSLPIIGNVYRPTGLYVEPSTFATYILWLLALKINFDNNVSKFSYVVCILAIATFSLAAMIYAALFIIVLYYASNAKMYNKVIVSFTFTLIPVVFSYVFSARLSALNGSGETLRANLNKLVFNQNVIDIVFGNGLYGLPEKVANLRTGSDLWRLGIAALNDNGLWLFLILKVGLVGLIITILIFFTLLRQPRDRVLFLILLMTKISFLSFTFVFVLYSLCVFRKNENVFLLRGKNKSE
nr:hypothetical protein [Mixta theicola]